MRVNELLKGAFSRHSVNQRINKLPSIAFKLSAASSLSGLLDRWNQGASDFMLTVSDIALKEAIGIADSLYNLQLVIEFCQQRPPSCPLHLSLNDLFYTHRDLTANLHAFIAELFYLFELSPIACVRDPATRNMNSVTKELDGM